MKKTIATIVILTTILTSCGPSAEQVAAEEKRKLDSATMAGQQQLLDQQATAQAEAEAAAQQEVLAHACIHHLHATPVGLCREDRELV